MTDQRQKVTNKIKNSHYSWNMIFFTLKKHLSSEAAHSQKKWKHYMNNNRPEETNLNISGTPWLPDKLCKHWFRLSEFWGLNCRHLNVSILWNATSSMTWWKTAVFAGYVMSDEMILYQMESIVAIFIFFVQKGGHHSREGDYPLYFKFCSLESVP